MCSSDLQVVHRVPEEHASAFAKVVYRLRVPHEEQVVEQAVDRVPEEHASRSQKSFTDCANELGRVHTPPFLRVTQKSVYLAWVSLKSLIISLYLSLCSHKRPAGAQATKGQGKTAV